MKKEKYKKFGNLFALERKEITVQKKRMLRYQLKDHPNIQVTNCKKNQKETVYVICLKKEADTFFQPQLYIIQAISTVKSNNFHCIWYLFKIQLFEIFQKLKEIMDCARSF
jgi:hypothetical protein